MSGLVSLFSSANPFKRKEGEDAAATITDDSPKGKRKNPDLDAAASAPQPKRLKPAKSRRRDEEQADEEVKVQNKAKKLRKAADEEQQPADQENGAPADHEKLQRTIFVGNLPLSTKKKVLIREFSCFGAVESARLRSVPVGTTKVPRKGAVMTGQLSEHRNSANAYVVFENADSARAALASNMKQFEGNHIRVDIAQPRSKSAVSYDNTRSIFVGNLPLDVEDEELYSIFHGDGCEVEAVRVVRDQKTNIGKGFAFVLFKSKEGLKHTFSRGDLQLRDRTLRLRRVSTAARKEEPVAAVQKVKPKKPRTQHQQPVTSSSNSGKNTYQGARSSKKKESRTRRIDTSSSSAVQKPGNAEKKRKRPAVAARKAKQQQKQGV